MAAAGPIRLGALIWNQQTDWPAMRATAVRADGLGYRSLWTWDHLYPIVGPPVGPMLEGYMVLAGFAAATSRATVGLMVGANTFRNPGLVVKMVTTLDHQSEGRAVLGLGGAWFEEEHRAFGIDFGTSIGERLARLDEAAELARTLLDGRPATARGEHYHAVEARNDPPPVQRRLPILIGGRGERKTLRTVARFADLWNVGNLPVDEAVHKLDVLRRWCDEIGRDPAEIELTFGLGTVVIRDDPADAQRLIEAFRARTGGNDRVRHAGPPEAIAEAIRPYVGLGFRHLVCGFPPPHDAETMERLIGEVVPQLV